MLAACPRWESAGGNADTSAGEARHIALSRALSNDPDPYRGLSEEDAAEVEWAAEYIRCKAPTSEHPLRIEFHVNPLQDDFTPLFESGGRLDVACGPVLFDLKNKVRNYTAQMAAYALAMFQEHGWESVEVHLLFAETKTAQVIKLTEARCHEIIDPIIAAVRDPLSQPQACEYCGWCARKLTCSALLTPAATIARAREELSPEVKASFEAWIGDGAHTSKIDDPALMGAVLKVARVLADWCEAAEYRAKDMALKQGLVPAGFKLQTRQGNRFITSVADAFPLVGLPQAEFLKACEVKLSSLVEAYATFHGQKKAPAERDVQNKLGDLVQRKPSTQILVAEKMKD